MKLFGFKNKNKETKLFITETDKNWVEDNFRWLIKVYGDTENRGEQALINKTFFPHTFKSERVEIENVICDLSELLNLDSEKITFEIIEDLRDSYGLPIETEGIEHETELEICDEKYKILITKSLIKRPNRLIYNLVYEFINIRLTESKLLFDTGDETSLFIHIAGIYFGFGVILSQNLNDVGRVSDGLWETKWNYNSEMPIEVMAYALALFSKITKNDNPVWRVEFPEEIKTLFDKAVNHLEKYSTDILKDNELESLNLFCQADNKYHNRQYDDAIKSLQKILLLTKDDFLKSDSYNYMGYIFIRKGDIENSILYLKKALDLNSNNGLANDNLGYALILNGQLENGRQYIEKAILTEDNDFAYTYRNLALYYFRLGEIVKAEENFELSFSSITEPVDLLEFYFAEFLISQGFNEKALKFLNIAVEKGEHEAIKRLNEITKNYP